MERVEAGRIIIYVIQAQRSELDTLIMTVGAVPKCTMSKEKGHKVSALFKNTLG